MQIYPRANIFLGFMYNYLFVAWQTILSLANTPVLPQYLHRKFELFYWEILLSSNCLRCLEVLEDDCWAFRFREILLASILASPVTLSCTISLLPHSTALGCSITIFSSLMGLGHMLLFTVSRTLIWKKNKNLRIVQWSSISCRYYFLSFSIGICVRLHMVM